MYLSKAMSFIKINKEDISIVETVLNPNVTYVSSSIGGPTGSKYVFNQRSSSEKVNLTRSLEFNTSVNSINEVFNIIFILANIIKNVTNNIEKINSFL